MVIIQQLVMKSLALFFVLFLFCVVISEHTSAESEMQNGTDIAQIPESGSTSGGTGNSSKSYPLGSSRGPPRFRKQHHQQSEEASLIETL
ncbi:unnamed protein product [Nezara viridula]|uniref:Neuropeptide n=1 Tax=Nezara viridula TaxID=85310 RepID=A0A9P0HTQ3_NEZVI|nr:unnamed protein product [Nezara viridula]